MAPTRFQKPIGLGTPQVVGADALPHAQSASQGPVGWGATHPDVPDPYVRELRELGLDLLQLALDLAGIVDPTPASDGASGLISLARGQWFDAAISGISMVPYIGDLAKAGKLPKYLRSLERAVELAGKSKKAAEALLPGFRKLKEALDLIPAGVNQQVDRMKSVVDQFLLTRVPTMALKQLPDISHRFKFSTTSAVRNGKQYQVKQASGRLGIPGNVKTHREASEKLQTKVSGGSGDDAGHLIGNQFGAPPGSQNLSKADAPLHAENLSRQNWVQNQGGGTYHDLESAWAEQLQRGTGIDVSVYDYFPQGSNRPSFRSVEWKEIHPDGRVTEKSLDFMNPHTPDASHRAGSRSQQDIPPTVDSPQTDNVTHVDFVKKRKIE